MNRLLSLFLILSLSAAAWARDIDISALGAVPDGATLNTAVIQQAIDLVSASGGGKVVIPQGRFLSGTLYLKSGVTLHLNANAVLLGSPNPLHYVKDPYCRWTAFIFAVKQHNVAIEGTPGPPDERGVIDCQGFTVATNLVKLIHQGVVADPLKYDRPNESIRPEIIHFRECDSVSVRSVTLRNPASWTQQYDQCTNLLLDGLHVDARAYWNNDGLDVVDCRNVVVRECFIDAADDAYCFKSHAQDGLSENVLVQHCKGCSSANGIKFGTLTRGTFRNFRFRDIIIFNTYRSAICIASVDGGDLQDISFEGISAIHTGNPLFIRFSQRNTANHPAALRNITIKDFYADVPASKPDAGLRYEGPIEDLPRNVSPASIIGTPNCRPSNIRLENVRWIFPGGADPAYAYAGSSPEQTALIPERDKQYPEFSMFKELPAWGLFVRHADSLSLSNVVFEYSAPDYRPAVVCSDAAVDTTHADFVVRPRFKGRATPKAASKALAASSDFPPDDIPPAAGSGPAGIGPAGSVSPAAGSGAGSGRSFNASYFGILSDGETLNTAAIQHAIDTLSALGGGTLVFYVGRYLTGPIQLKSNVAIRLNEGAVLVSVNQSRKPLIQGSRVTNVALIGKGVVESPRTPISLRRCTNAKIALFLRGSQHCKVRRSKDVEVRTTPVPF